MMACFTYLLAYTRTHTHTHVHNISLVETMILHGSLEYSTGPKPNNRDGDILLPIVPLGLDDLSAVLNKHALHG